jgi:Lipocalin-like domain
MKKLVVTSIVFLMVLVGAASCDKDEDSETANTGAALEGKWQNSKEGTIVNGKEVLVDYVPEAGCTKNYIEFLSKNIFKGHYFYNPNCQEDIYTATWTKNSNSFVLTNPNEPNYTTEILELTTTTLKIKEVEAGVSYITVYTRI